MLLEYLYLYLQYYMNSYVHQIQKKVFVFQLPKLIYNVEKLIVSKTLASWNTVNNKTLKITSYVKIFPFFMQTEGLFLCSHLVHLV